MTIKLRTEHRLGEVLAETVQQGGHNKKQGDNGSLCLPEEITRKQSSRCQQLAELPWEEIETRIEQKTENPNT